MKLDGPERAMGLDVGDRRIGVALSDGLMLTAQPFQVLERKSEDEDMLSLQKIAQDNGVTMIVVGIPVMMNNTAGVQAGKVKAFISLLEARLGLPVETVDERLTTRLMEREMIADGVRREKRRQKIDMLAAASILQLYLDRRRLDNDRR